MWQALTPSEPYGFDIVVTVTGVGTVVTSSSSCQKKSTHTLNPVIRSILGLVLLSLNRTLTGTFVESRSSLRAKSDVTP